MSYHKKGDDFELGCVLEDDGVIYLTMRGNLTEDHVEEMEEWSACVRDTMRASADRHPGNVLTLIDATGVRETDSVSSVALQELMEHNKQYVTRTAVFGVGFFQKLIVETALKLTQRTNLRMFNTREEAETWLHAQE